MSIKGQKIEIRRSELHSIVDVLPLWEVPVISAVHDDDVKVLEEVTIADRDMPNPKEEFERLEARYKRARNEDGSFGLPVVATVYGQHGAGVAALSRAIQDAAVGADSLV